MYVPPSGDSVSAVLVSGYVVPSGNDVSSAPSSTLVLTPEGIEGFVSGDALVSNASRSVFPEPSAAPDLGNPFVRFTQHSITPCSVPKYFGHQPLHDILSDLTRYAIGGARADVLGQVPGPQIDFANAARRVYAAGINSFAVGHAHNVENAACAVVVPCFAALSAGSPTIYNRRAFVTQTGFTASRAGTAFVSGGVKTVKLSGITALSLPSPVVINTTADQTTKPSSIAAPALAGPVVSPRMLYPTGWLGAMGYPRVQFPPHPSGFSTEAYGTPVVEFKTKWVMPAGIGWAEAAGFPRAFDPKQTVYPAPVIQSAVFGDTAIVNRSLIVRVAGFDSLETSAWALLANTRRYLVGEGLASAEFGGLAIANKSPSIAPLGVAPIAPSGVGIGHSVRTITASLGDGLRFGSPKLTKTPSLSPAGIAGALGAATIWPRVRTLEAAGGGMQKFGAASVWFRYRYLTPASFAVSGYGNPKVELGIRTLTTSGAAQSSHGTPMVANADRAIAPKSIYEEFAAKYMVGGLRFLNPVGFDAARFGSRVLPEIQPAYPLGFAGSYGQAGILNHRKIVSPSGITTGVQPADRWGTAHAWNRRQIVTLFYDVDSALNPPAWPQWTKIENRTRVVRTSGVQTSRIGTQQIDNGARPLLPAGIDAPATGAYEKPGLVAFRIRPLPLEGIDAPYLSTWASLRNSAAVLAPSGKDAALFGLAALENTRRIFDRIGRIESGVCGYPMIADRIRTLTFESRYGIAPPSIALPGVKLYTRYVEGSGIAGFDASGIGNASLSIHWTLITPRWTLQHFFGEPKVHNVTPEIVTKGRAADEFGTTFVRLEWRPVASTAGYMTLFGKPKISDWKQRASVTGNNALAFGDKLTVVKTGAPPYSTQIICLEAAPDSTGNVAEGDGIPPPWNEHKEQTGRPVINQQVIYALEESVQTKFGTATVRANSIRVEPGYAEISIGTPGVSLKVRTLVVAKFPDGAVFLPEKPRLSPHTIYAVVEAPQQAIINHPVHNLHYVDGYYRAPGARFGAPEVTLQNRVIKGYYADTPGMKALYGTPTVQLKRHYILPTGFSMFRFGWHSIPGTQTVEQYDSMRTSLYGTPAVEHVVPPGPRTVKAQGVTSQTFGASQIDLFRRTIKATGYVATKMGLPAPPGNPYQWQGLRVGPLMPTIPKGSAMEVFGTPWISLRVRGVSAEGFDAFVSEYQLEAFDQRMRVTRQTIARPFDTLAPEGFDASAVGAPDFRPGTQYIRPDGDSDQFRKGGF